MSSPPLIGLTGHRRSLGDVRGYPDFLDELEIEIFPRADARAIIAAGGLPLFVPLDVDVHAVVARLDGVVLTGGADLDPRRYGAQLTPEVATGPFPPQVDRDDLELRLAAAAIDADQPVLGICRGAQLLNVLGGGTLVEDLDDHSQTDLGVDARTHDLVIAEGSTLADLYGSQLKVNSLHHQGIDRVADGWAVTARADDGVVEAIELPGKPVVAVQWHPELLTTATSDPLYRWLIASAEAR